MKGNSFYAETMRLRHRVYLLFCALSEATERLWQGKFYFPLLLIVTLSAVALHEALWGASILLMITAWMFLFCPDVMAGISAGCVMTLLATEHYTDMGAFLPCMPLLLIAVVALATHLLVWPLELRVGRSCRGLLLVSAAAVLGGMGAISQVQALKPMSLYYSLGLGVMLLFFYLLTRSQMAKVGGEETLRRFAGLFYTIGLGAAGVIFLAYIEHWDPTAAVHVAPDLRWRNFIATILVTTLPVPFGFAVKHKGHLLSAVILTMALVVTGSRMALLFGAVELVLCCCYLVRWGVISKRVMKTLLLVGVAAAIILGPQILAVALGGRTGENDFHGSNVIRLQLIARGVEDFLRYPLFGIGLNNPANADLYPVVDGSMVFYHSLPIQVMASMGMLGVVAYGVLFHDRLTLLRDSKSSWADMLGLCYIGMLLVSMVNPGEFCPFPNAVLMTIAFSAVEEAVDDPVLSIEQLSVSWYRIWVGPWKPALRK